MRSPLLQVGVGRRHIGQRIATPDVRRDDAAGHSLQNVLGALSSLSTAGSTRLNNLHPQGKPTTSCGSGPAVVNGIRRGLLDATVHVHCDGGTVTVHWAGEGGVVLTGSVEPVLQGSAYLP